MKYLQLWLRSEVLKWYYDQIFYRLIFWAFHVEFHERMKMPFTVFKYLH